MSNSLHTEVPQIIISANKNQLPQQTILLQPSVNSIPQGQAQSKAITNLDNYSIINKKDNQIPSLKNELSNHKQNSSTLNNHPQAIQIETLNQPSLINKNIEGSSNQKNTSTKKAQETIKKIQINHPNTELDSKLFNGIQKQLQPINKSIVPNNLQYNTNFIEIPQITTINQSSSKITQTVKIKESETVKSKQQIENPKAEKSKTQTQDVKLQQVSPDKDVTKIQNKLSAQQNFTLTHPKQLISQNLIQKQLKLPKAQQQYPKANKQQGNKQKSLENKAVDNPQPSETKVKELNKKPQHQSINKTEKQVQQKLNVSDMNKISQLSGISFGQLLNCMVQKCKQKQQSLKTSIHSQVKMPQDNSLDLNLSLASSRPLDQSTQCRVKLQFKLIKRKVANTLKEQIIFQTAQKVNPQLSKQYSDKLKSQNSSKSNSSDVKLCFDFYNLKNHKAKQSLKTQVHESQGKENDQLERKLKQATRQLDKDSFRFKINSKLQSDQFQSNSPIKTLQFDISPQVIQASLGIKKETLQSFNAIVDSIQNQSQTTRLQTESKNTKPVHLDKQIQSKSETQIDSSNHQNTKDSQRQQFLFKSSAQLTLSSMLKDIQTSKFLSTLLGGFNLKFHTSRNIQAISSYPNSFQEVLRQAVLGLLPAQLTQYFSGISSGFAKIKFKSIQNFKQLLMRLRVTQLLDQTPTTKEVLKQLILNNFKSLFLVRPKHEVSANSSVKQSKDNKERNQIKETLSALWEIFQIVLSQARCQGLRIKVILNEVFCMEFTLQSHFSHINEIWNQITQ